MTEMLIACLLACPLSDQPAVEQSVRHGVQEELATSVWDSALLCGSVA